MTLSEHSKKLLAESFRRAKSLQPPDDFPQLLNVKKRTRSSSPMPPPGSTEDDGRQSKTLNTNISVQQNLPAPAEQPKEIRRQNNLLNPVWRNGFGCLMITLSAATLKKFSVVQVCLWAQALSEHELEDLQKAFANYIQSEDSFPTAGKVFELANKERRKRLGIIVR